MMRLVIMVSLAGYSLSNANAAMHGSSFPELQVAASGVTPSHEGHDMAEAAHHGPLSWRRIPRWRWRVEARQAGMLQRLLWRPWHHL